MAGRRPLGDADVARVTTHNDYTYNRLQAASMIFLQITGAWHQGTQRPNASF